MMRKFKTLVLSGTVILSLAACDSEEITTIEEVALETCYQNLMEFLPEDFTGTACGICSSDGVLLSDSLSITDSVDELQLISVFYQHNEGITTYDATGYESGWDLIGDGIEVRDESIRNQLTVDIDTTFSDASIFARFETTSGLQCSTRVVIVEE